MAQTVAPPAPTTALPPPAPFLPAVMSMGGDGMGFNPGIPGTPILPTVMEGGFGGEEIRDFPEYDDEAEVTEAAGGDVEDDFAPGERDVLLLTTKLQDSPKQIKRIQTQEIFAIFLSATLLVFLKLI